MLNIILFFAVWILLWSPIAFLLGRKLRWDFPNPPTPEQKIPLVLSLYVLAPPLLWFWVHRSGWMGSGVMGSGVTGSGLTLANYGWAWSGAFALRVGSGLGLAVLSLVLLWGLERLLGWITFELDAKALLKLVGPILAVAIAISVVEELLFRGFLFEELVSTLGNSSGLGSGWVVIVALGLTNLVFALLHLPWDRWQAVVPQLPGLWVLGLVLSLAYLRWGDLAMAIGLHAGWVWAIASLDTVNGIQYTGKVPAWVTGVGGYLLAGVMGVGFLGVIGGLIFA